MQGLYLSLLIFLGFLVLIGCGGSSGGGGRITERFDPEQCRIPVDQKAERFETLWSHEQEEGPFGKVFQTQRLQNFVQTSYLDVLEQLQGTVDFYKIREKEKPPECNALHSIKLAPKEAHAAWDKAFAEAGSGLAGIYFNACDLLGDCSYQDNFRPTIIVRETASKWVTVHEYMHYNFDYSRRQAGYDHSAIYGQLNALVGKLERSHEGYNESPSRRLMGHILDQFKEVQELFFLTLINSSLEEVAVEALLIDLWANGHLVYVPERSPLSGLRYMSDNLQKASSASRSLSNALHELERETLARGWGDLQERIELQRSLSEEFFSRAEQYLQDATLQVRRKQRTVELLKPSALPRVSDASYACKHHHDASEKIEMIKNVMEKIITSF